MNDSLRILTILSPVLFIAGSGAVAQAPSLSPPNFLPAQTVVGPAIREQRTPVVSRGAGASLVVWEDTRTGESDLYGIRVDASGAPIDPLPFVISSAPGHQTAPAISWNGQNWLVAFKNQAPSPFGYYLYQFAGVRVSPAGHVLDASPLVAGQDDSGGTFSVASNGNEWVIGYTGYSAGNSDIRVTRIDASGNIINPGGTIIVSATYFIYFGVNIQFNQDEYLVTWSDSGLKGRRFNPQLVPIDANPVSLLATMPDSIACNNNEFFLVYTRQTPQFTSEIVATRIGHNLNIINNNPLRISGSTSTQYYQYPSVCWDGTQWICAWSNSVQNILRAARVSAAGQVLDGNGGVVIPYNSTLTSYNLTIGALPSGGGLLAWSDIRYSGGNNTYDTFANAVTANGIAGAEYCIATAAESMRNPKVAWGNYQALMTCQAQSPTSSRVLAQRLDAVGNPVDSPPMEVISGAANVYNSGGVAWNGNYYLITFSNATNGNTYGRRLTADGIWLDAAPFVVLAGYSSDVAALGEDFLVTALRSPGYWQTINSYGARVRGFDGAVMDNPPLLVGGSYATKARPVALGQRWLVVTESHFSHDSNQAGIITTFVDAGGITTTGPNALSVNIQSWGSMDVASSGSSALIVSHSGSNWVNASVQARRILPDGTLSGPQFLLTSTTLGQSKPAVCWTGSEYVVLWEDLGNNSWYYDYEPDIFAARVSESGSLIDTTPFPVWNGEDYEIAPSAVGTGTGRALFVASAIANDAWANYKVSSVMMSAAGIHHYGAGTAGCDGPQRMETLGSAHIGDPAFLFYCKNAPQGALGLGLITDVADVAGSDTFGLGVLLHVSLVQSTEIIPFDFISDLTGTGIALSAIPNDTNLVGRHYYAQGIWYWTTCPLPPMNLSSSDGIEIIIQP